MAAQPIADARPTARWTSGCALLLAFGLCTAAWGQESTTFLNQQRQQEEQLRPLIQPNLFTNPAEQRLEYDYGGVLRYTVLGFEDHGPDVQNFICPPPFNVQNCPPELRIPVDGRQRFQAWRDVQNWDIRPWASASLDRVHYLFVRGQFDHLQYGTGDEYYLNNDWRGPYVDIGFYRLDVDEAARRYHGAHAEHWGTDLTIGRQFLFLGRGLAFAQVFDAVSVDAQAGNWMGLAFGGESIEHFDNIDRSVPGYPSSSRNYYGAQLVYQGFDHHRPYAYAAWQRDHSGEQPTDFLQDYTYDSNYFGVGMQGETILHEAEFGRGIKNLSYFAEFIVQTGRSFGIGSVSRRDEIEAYAFDTGLIYYMDVFCRPRLLLEYAYATGDPERRNPQNTLGGNVSGTTDQGFLGFGYLNTGYSFAPLLANLQFVRGAAAIRPFDDLFPCGREPACRNEPGPLEIGASYYAYWRPEANAGVSDARADIPGDHFLGTELDLFMNWRVSSDVYILLNHGHFWPNGDSFSVSRSRQFTGVTAAWLF